MLKKKILCNYVCETSLLTWPHFAPRPQVSFLKSSINEATIQMWRNTSKKMKLNRFGTFLGVNRIRFVTKCCVFSADLTLLKLMSLLEEETKLIELKIKYLIINFSINISIIRFFLSTLSTLLHRYSSIPFILYLITLY